MSRMQRLRRRRPIAWIRGRILRLQHVRQRRPVAWMTGWILLAFVVYRGMPLQWEGRSDVVLTILLAVAFTRAAWRMVHRTRTWTWRGQGLLGTVAGDALLYSALGFGAVLGVREGMLDLARACLTVGVVHLLIGMERPPADEEDEDEMIVENREEPHPAE